MPRRGAGKRPGTAPRSSKPKAARKGSAARSALDPRTRQLVERMKRERDEALELQAASADVLKIISSSPGDLKPVFEAMLSNALRICDAKFGHILLYDGEGFHATHLHDVPPSYRAFWNEHGPIRPNPNTGLGRLAVTKQTIHIPDLKADPAYARREPLRVVTVEQAGARSFLAVPMTRENELIGAIVIYRQELLPFAEKQIELVQNFAAQAVIAIENTRLLKELRESLQQQIATADVLKVINSSPGNLAPVFEAILEKAHGVCGVTYGSLQLYDGNAFRAVAVHGLSDEFAQRLRHGYVPGPNHQSLRLIAGERFVHTPDLREIDDPIAQAAFERSGIRTALFIPLRNDGRLIGKIVAARREVRPFSQKEIELLENFAAQAVIAIESARLFGELRDRQAELRVTFDNMGDGVVMFGADTRLVAWNRNFQTILDLPDELLASRPSYLDYIRILASRGEFGTDVEAELSRRLQDTERELAVERTRPDGRIIEVRRNPVPGGGFVLIYADVTERKRSEQAIRVARDVAEAALRDLQAAQASLVHAQKMAALGQLTAGIAHEIKNPLNFVNNFAGLSVELLEELKEAAAEAIGTLDAGKRSEVLDTMQMLTGNLARIAEHGRRADGIVRGMLQHSRGSSGDWQATDLNALVEESLNLAYHGARAQDQDFQVSFELDLDRSLEPIELVSQDVSSRSPQHHQQRILCGDRARSRC